MNAEYIEAQVCKRPMSDEQRISEVPEQASVAQRFQCPGPRSHYARLYVSPRLDKA